MWSQREAETYTPGTFGNKSLLLKDDWNERLSTMNESCDIGYLVELNLLSLH